jgi:hypothetical protein
MLPMPEHLTTQQITDLLARQLAPVALGAAAAHLAACPDCRRRVNEAKHTAARIAYVRAVLAMDEAPAAAPERDWRHRWAAFWSRPFWQPLAAATATLLLLLAGWSWWSKARQPADNIIVAASPTPLPSLPPEPTPSPAVLLALNDNGRQIRLDQTGQITGLPALPPAYEQAVKQALTKERVPLPAELNALRPAARTLLGEAEEPARLTLLSPVGTFVKEARPQFCWRTVRGAQSYTVTVLDDAFNHVAASEPLAKTCWQPPRALPRNRQYVWQVTAQTADRQLSSTSAALPEARFKVLSVAQTRELRRAARDYAAAHLVLGALYAQAGLLDDAERELRRLLKANPHSTTARRLLSQLPRHNQEK